ncbi:23S rRNA (uracil(1939)-C(5))-methyltransferase RlmD [Candidatus Stoquefichus sp. SB1]|uniref:23S rRNA (uracil(1939)-C(5))-methyltransferase RlmD n=1 Tax=Candidatus Stoquefichus sp. SB1 TaxID=1658109 RepID=UPI00067EDC91|nr:23S rRNA (uracil(1939)-C(5))-methyltransferase RlmD [Candidatus Stoquefichus sp. SB1]
MRKERVEIKKLGINGEGIGYINKKICFIDNAMPGEIVEVEITNENPKFYKGKVLQYIEKSTDRVDTICKEDRHCQGCSLTSLAYSKHLPYKKGILKDALKKYTSFDVDKLPIKATYPSPIEKGYRHVVSLPITYFKGKVHAGIYQRETKYLTLMNGCPMQDSLINECLVKIEDILNNYHVRDYNDKIKKGLRFMKLRNIDGQIQVLFVTGQDGIKSEVIEEISQIDAVKSIWFTINTTRHQEFELQGYKKVYGQSTLPFTCFNQQYLYSVKSEFPMNPDMEKVKLDIIRSMIPTDASVLSLNCGVGVLELALENPQIIAIDEKNYHIKDAKDNAKFLHKDNVDFLCKNINEGTISQCKKQSFDYIIVRSEELSSAMKQSFVLSKSKNVIYVSDHPSSLAKDLEELSQYFEIESILPLDTYPYTAKLETIVKLKRK